jgi:hypothetical protein
VEKESTTKISSATDSKEERHLSKCSASLKVIITADNFIDMFTF